jgi:hypothetical protein
MRKAQAVAVALLAVSMIGAPVRLSAQTAGGANESGCTLDDIDCFVLKMTSKAGNTGRIGQPGLKDKPQEGLYGSAKRRPADAPPPQ